MKTIWLSLSLAAFVSTLVAASPLPPAPKIVVSSENPALMVKNVEIDSHDGKIRGTVYLRFGYGAPRLPHVHVYGLNASGRVVAEGCGKLSGTLFENPRPAGKAHEEFSAKLAKWDGVTSVLVIASAGHSKDCKPEDNRIFKLF